MLFKHKQLVLTSRYSVNSLEHTDGLRKWDFKIGKKKSHGYNLLCREKNNMTSWFRETRRKKEC